MWSAVVAKSVPGEHFFIGGLGIRNVLLNDILNVYYCMVFYSYL